MGMEMDFLEEAVEDKPCLQQAASSEFDTPMLNMASWAGPTASFRSDGQALNNFQPTILQHGKSNYRKFKLTLIENT